MVSQLPSNIFVNSLALSVLGSQTTCFTPVYLFRRQFTFSVTESWKYVWLCAIKGASPGNTTVTFDFSPIFHSISDMAASNASFCWLSFGFSILREAITKIEFRPRQMGSKLNIRLWLTLPAEPTFDHAVAYQIWNAWWCTLAARTVVLLLHFGAIAIHTEAPNEQIQINSCSRVKRNIRNLTSFTDGKTIAVRVHSPLGGAAAEPNTTFRSSCQ